MSGLRALIEAQKAESFREPEKTPDEKALGILIARHFKYDADAIVRTAAAALTDSNFHAESASVLALAVEVRPLELADVVC